MGWNEKRLLVDWIEAERTGPADLSEARLRAAMRAVPRRRPSRGFADRVLVAAGMGRRRLDWSATWWGRTAMALGCLLVGSAVLSLPLGPASLVDVPSCLASAFTLVVSAMVWGADSARHVLAVGSVLLDVGEAVQLTATTPAIITVVAVSTLTAAAALAALVRLLGPREELVRC